MHTHTHTMQISLDTYKVQAYKYSPVQYLKVYQPVLLEGLVIQAV